MKRKCGSCHAELSERKEQAASYPITGGICSDCAQSITGPGSGAGLADFLDSLAAPVLLMQPEPRQVYAANRRALELFGKDISQVVGYRGGQVFDCIHAFTEAGCGKDVNCEGCKIKNAVVETFETGKSFPGVSTELEIKKNSEVRTHHVQISTEKLGHLALLRIDRFEKKAKA